MSKAALLLLLAGSVVATIPAWPYSRRWGYLPSSLIGAVLLLFLTGIVFGWV